MNFKAHKFCNYIGKTSIKCSELRENYPPAYENPYKKQIYQQALYAHKNQNGIVRISRVEFDDDDGHKSSTLKLKKNDFNLKTIPGFYDYLSDKVEDNETSWYVNFADPQLFGFYDGDCFAQDEIQTLEMPMLASSMVYLDSLKDEKFRTRTVEKVVNLNTTGRKFIRKPTPYLFENVPLWVSINTTPELKDGSKVSIYGRNFRHAPKEAIEAGVSLVTFDYKVNIMAIAAPEGGKGLYQDYEIQQILETLISSFSAAVKQTKEQKKEKCIIHSGNWGCGAFGGNLELIYLCQIYAASVCGVDQLVLHDCKTQLMEDVLGKYDEIQQETTLAEVSNQLLAYDFKWYVSDGN